MGRITFSADPMHEETVEEVQNEDGVESQSGAVRECIERYARLQQRDEELQQALSNRDARIEDLQQTVDSLKDELEAVREERDALQNAADRVEELEQTVERLQNEKRLILEDREEKKDLVRAVERERSLAEKKAQAGVITRVKWWVSGMPENGEQAASNSE